FGATPLGSSGEGRPAPVIGCWVRWSILGWSQAGYLPPSTWPFIFAVLPHTRSYGRIRLAGRDPRTCLSPGIPPDLGPSLSIAEANLPRGSVALGTPTPASLCSRPTTTRLSRPMGSAGWSRHESP